MLEINVQKKHLDKARSRAEGFKGNKFTFSKNADSKIAGFLAEEIFVANFGGLNVADGNFYHDVEAKIGQIDIKTKRCKSAPKPDYDCSVTKYQLLKAKCDYFLFCRCSYEFDKIWVCGMIPVEEFKEKSVLIRKGERQGPFVCSADMYNVKISDLYNVAEIMYS